MGQYSIVIADDDRDLTQVLATRCQKLGLHVRTAHSALEALNLVHDVKPNVICLDVNMPSGSGLTACEMLAADPQLARIPVIIMTGDSAPDTIRRCHNLCAFYVEKCSDLWPRIEPLIWDLLADLGEEPTRGEGRGARGEGESLAAPALVGSTCSVATATQRVDASASAANESLPWLGQASDAKDSLQDDDFDPMPDLEDDPEYNELPSDQKLADLVFGILGADDHFLDRTPKTPAADEPPWVLCIDDDADYTAALKIRLESHGIAVIRAFEGMEGYRFAFARPADLILLDFEMPNGQGDYILGKLKSNPITQNIPVIVITGRKDRALQRKMISMGTSGFMHKPISFVNLVKELQKHIDVLPQPPGGKNNEKVCASANRQ